MYSLGNHPLVTGIYAIVRRHLAGLLALTVLFCYIPWGVRQLTSPKILAGSQTVVRHIRAPGRWIVLIIDEDSPKSVTPKVLDDLVKVHAKATFFFPTVHSASLKIPIEEILQAGDAVGNHTEGHINLAAHSLTEDVHDLTQANRTLQFFGAPRPTWLLPPYGAINHTVLRAAQETGLRLVLPSRGDRVDNLENRQSAIIQEVMSHVEPGDILMFHVTRLSGESLTALPLIIQLLVVEGYHIGSLSEVDGLRRS